MKEKVINLLGIRQRVVLCRIDDLRNKNVGAVMQPLTEEQELAIEKTSDFTKEDGTVIPANKIYLYGEINFNNPEDLALIEQFNLLDNANGSFVYSNFDYEQGCYTVIDETVKWCPTWDAVKYFKYCHCLIGKPKNIIVYKDSINYVVRRSN